MPVILGVLVFSGKRRKMIFIFCKKRKGVHYEV